MIESEFGWLFTARDDGALLIAWTTYGHARWAVYEVDVWAREGGLDMLTVWGFHPLDAWPVLNPKPCATCHRIMCVCDNSPWIESERTE